MLTNKDIATLQRRADRLEELAHARGLRPFPTQWHIVPSEIMYEFGAYGMPGRFSHWSHGRDYFRMKTMYDVGYSKIYELVINTNPSLAFLMSNNTVTQNTFVIAHVYGHTDFFAQNIHFAGTERNMVEVMNMNAERLAGYRQLYGDLEVERVLDAGLALAPHVDAKVAAQIEESQAQWLRDRAKLRDWRPERGEYADLLGPSPDSLKPKEVGVTAPVLGDDLLYIISKYAVGMEEWQRDALDIVRREQLYFNPQGKTKIFNEGWAVFWHLRLLRDLEEITIEEGIDIANLHSGVACPHPGSLNPYYLGWQVLEAINRNHGGDENSCADYLFELRERENDISLLRNELTEEMVRDLDLFLFSEKDEHPQDPYIWQICSTTAWEKVRDNLVNSIAGRGQPRISVLDANFNNGELLMEHKDDGLMLDLEYAEKTLEYVERLWGRPVALVTRNPVDRDGKVTKITMHYDRNRKHRRSPGTP
jgi:stage V sporulation protein R